MLLKGLKYSLLAASVVLALSGCDGDEGNKNAAAAPAAKQTVKSTAVSDNAAKDGGVPAKKTKNKHNDLEV